MIIDQWENLPKYNLFAPEVETAILAFQRAATADLPAGPNVLLEGRLRANVIETRTRPRAETVFETHQVEADLQVLLAGREDQAWAPAATLAPRGDYNEKDDYRLYEAEGAAAPARLTLAPGLFVYYAPGEAHLTACLPEGASPADVRKIVYKIVVPRHGA